MKNLISGRKIRIARITLGLREKNRFLIANFLKSCDQYLVDKKILNSTNLFLEAKN
tara:strand:- start:432 stop:599 length:168 start_codon:yes stop_codon:yes gene_type:complete